MLFKFIRTFKRIVKKPYLNIIVGIIFLYSGILETVIELKEIEGFKVGAHHGSSFLLSSIS